MRIRHSILALISATALVACSNSNTGNGTGKKDDLSVAKADLADDGNGDLLGAADLRRAKADLTDTGDDQAAPDDGDMMDDGSDMTDTSDLIGADLTGVTTADLTGVPQDLSVVTAPGDMASTDQATSIGADLSSTDMTPPPACGTTPTLDVKTMLITSADYEATGTATYKMPSGFLVSGTITLTGGEAASNVADTTSFEVRLVDQFTGAVYTTTTGTLVPDITTNLVYAYSLVVPPGQYFVSSHFGFVFNDTNPNTNSDVDVNAQVLAFRTEPATLTVCPALAATATTQNIVHEALPTLVKRSVQVGGLAATYATKSIDPDPTNNPLYDGSLYLESTDGRLLFFKHASAYHSTEQDILDFQNFPLPNSATGYVVQPTFSARLGSTDDNGYTHYFRFDNTKNITFNTTANSAAFAKLTIAATDIVKVFGTATDTSGRLFKPWTNFNGQYDYEVHAANCPQTLPSNNLYVAPTSSGQFFTDNPQYGFALKKGAACDFYAGLSIRLPLASNQGASPAVPANLTNPNGNDLFIIYSSSSSFAATTDSTINIDVPSLSGDITRTINVQNAAGTALPNVVVHVETPALTDFQTYSGAADDTETSATGQVVLNLLKGNYRVTLTAP